MSYITYKITYKMLNGLIDIDRENFFRMSNSYTRGHCKKLYKPFSRLKIRSQFFSQRVIDEWNSLPNSVASSVSLSDFKRNYDTYYGDKKIQTLKKTPIKFGQKYWFI